MKENIRHNFAKWTFNPIKKDNVTYVFETDAVKLIVIRAESQHDFITKALVTANFTIRKFHAASY